MATCSTETNKSHKIRSLSLPSKLNPINQKIEYELKKLVTKEESTNLASERINIGVNGVAELYKCINQALSLPITQQALSLRQHEKHVAEILRASSAISKLCSAMLEVVQQQGAISKVLLSCLSDEIESSEVETNVTNYFLARKEVVRKAKGVISSLEELNAQLITEENDQGTTLINSLRCVSMINLSVYESLLHYVSMPVPKKKRSLVSKLMNKESSKSDSGNEINDLDNMMQELVSDRTVSAEMLCFSLGKLKKLVGLMDGVESGLANMSKQLAETKACLMNIVSF